MTLDMLIKAVETMQKSADTAGLSYHDVVIEARIGNGKHRNVHGWSWGRPQFKGVMFRVD